VTRWTAAAVAALVLLPLASCTSADDSTAPYTLELDGTARVAGGALLHDGEHALVVGDTLRLQAGSATLTLPGDATLELRAGPNGTVLEIGPVPTLVDGDALLLAGDKGLRLRSGAASIELVDGAARVRRATGVDLAVYQGEATVESFGADLTTPALRQTAISDTGTLPLRPLPLVYDRASPDPWDVRFLGDAIEMGAELDRWSRAITVEAATRPDSDVALVRMVVPSLGPDVLSPALVDPDRSLGETVVGASIALGGDGAFAERWDDALALRDEGADWGLVALDQRAERGRVLGLLDEALDRLTPTVLVAARRTSPTAPFGVVASVFLSSTTSTSVPAAPAVEEPGEVDGPPSKRDDPDVRSADHDRRDGRRGHRAQAVLDELSRLRPVRGEGVPRRGGDDDGRPARAREGLAGPDRRGRGAHDRKHH
jgi:hypothetical protein